MSTEKKDMTSSVDDAVRSPDLTVLAGGSQKSEPQEQEVKDAKKVEISKTELDDLAGLLHSYRSVILAHEERLLEHEGRITQLEAKKPVKLEIPRGRFPR